MEGRMDSSLVTLITVKRFRCISQEAEKVEGEEESRMGFQETWSMFAAAKVVSSGVH